MKPPALQYLEDAWPDCPRDARLLGIDHGTRTLGLALCDPGQTLATPLKTIRRAKFEADVAALKTVIADYGVRGLIVGWPLEAHGAEGPRCQSVRDYMAMLAPRLDLWWAVWDERLSTADAHRLMAEDMGLSFARRKQAVDALAAQTILQSALDFMTANRNTEAGPRSR
ncbi:MAG: Holliday junction resolvase RuvX [Rhodospirillales bacterium]|nr:Holliday junction resolvase RuvX [Alphaproteobacteria bacterium]MCB9987502.1 Holliday junction resolvase RuvX [Rhodospirillales bacterium]USO07524.1 MAG: Holliday junction resolvase RuvX [Rhodospirillales bacterium]